MNTTILDLPELLNKIDQDIFKADLLPGRLKVPPPLAPKVARWYGRPTDTGSDTAILRASEQRVVRTINAYTSEGAQFNERRAERPVPIPDTALLASFIEAAKKDCDFCDPLNMTCEDLWGRINGKYCVTAANAAKYDASHGMVIFNAHHPHSFGRDEIRDYVETAVAWLHRTNAEDRSLKYPFIMWNCLGSAGASLVHGHLHMLVNPCGFYARHAVLVSATDAYRTKPDREYWRDWTSVHTQVGLGVDLGDTAIVAAITPSKEKEVVILDHGSRGTEISEAATNALADVLRTFIDRLGVLSFNVGIYLPPIDAYDYRLPLIIRCVDRGDPSPLPPGKSKTADVGGMEFYGSPVVAFDPFKVIDAVKQHIGLT